MVYCTHFGKSAFLLTAGTVEVGVKQDFIPRGTLGTLLNQLYLE